MARLTRISFRRVAAFTTRRRFWRPRRATSIPIWGRRKTSSREGEPYSGDLRVLASTSIVDRRCGDLLKALPAIRAASDGGAERLYKPLMLLVAVGRAASGEARLAPFTVYEELLEPLLTRFADGHRGSGIQNAWWRLPGDGLWEVIAASGDVLRPVGERARSDPPGLAELRTQSGGMPERFYAAVREVDALAATVAGVLVERFFADHSPEDKRSLISLALGTRSASASGENELHLVVKWSPNYEPETIARHQEVIDRHGAVWWAIFSQSSEQWQIGQQWLDELGSQLASDRETFVFISGETCWRARLVQLETDRDQVDPALIPDYYARLSGWQVLWLKLTQLEQRTRDDLLRLLDPANKPGKPVALGNRTNPLMVRLRTRPRLWWVNQGASFGRATEGGHLWAPQLDKNGRPHEYWQTMRHLRPGDVVLHYANTQIRGWSLVQGEPFEAPRPDPDADQAWNNDGVRAEVAYRDLETGLPLSEIPAEWRLSEGGPFDKNGAAKQGYLFPVSDHFAAKLKGRFPASMDT